MGQQMEQMAAENENLKKSANQMANTLSTMSARRGSQPTQPAQPPMKMGEAGGGPESPNAIVDNARNMMGVPTGAQLPV